MDAFNWWMTHQKETIELMNKFPDVTTMMSMDDGNGNVIVHVGTLDGKPIQGFPQDVDGAKVVFASMRPQFL